jgi:nucleoside-diphosphate-sugar epimerase
MSGSPLVLVTGSAGRIGQAVVQELRARGRPVRGFDRLPTPGLADCVVGNLTDVETVGRACANAGAVVHLAATPDDADFLTELVPNNLIGVHHVFEAARAAGVRRLVLASSGQVVWWQRMRGPWPIQPDAPPTPRSWYAACKLFLEAAGRAFAEGYGMSVIVGRLGWCPRTREHVQELIQSGWGQDVYLSPGDAGRFFACAVDAPADLRFAIVNACSKPVSQPQYDPEAARRLVGFEPQDRWPQGIEAVVGQGGLGALS